MDIKLSSKNTSVFAGTLGAIALSVVAAGCSSQPSSPTANAPVPTGSPAAGSGSTAFSSYKDGTFTAKGAYDTHAGPEEVTITVTLKDGVITDTQFQGVPSLKMSQRFMDMFSNNYKTLVVGKKIDEVNLGKVSGSSLTPIGFNNALQKIKQEAGLSSS